jgi:hypothetical protein
LNGHTIFATPEEGWRALYRQLQLIIDGKSNVYRLDMTIAEMSSKYAEWSVNWAKNVSARLGVPVSTPIRDLLV